MVKWWSCYVQCFLFIWLTLVCSCHGTEGIGRHRYKELASSQSVDFNPNILNGVLVLDW